AWQHLLRSGCAAGADEILLANDSVFGPLGDLRPIFATMRQRKLDAWGMVASTEGVWHLQSWFVWLSAAALARPAVQRVFTQPFADMDKPEIILHGELGLGVALRAEKLACGARFEEPRRSRLRRLAKPVRALAPALRAAISRRATSARASSASPAPMRPVACTT
ncbi:MAG: hypothetical protein J0H99_17220, partial [Rhodospirillales bacterium]|nr:hypothetical protein [Rhodospirillales bacterium]